MFMPSIAPGRKRSLAAETNIVRKVRWLRISTTPNVSSSAAFLLHYAFLMAFYLHSQMEGEHALRGYGQNCCRPR
jgi:hypothetical protein